MSPELVPHRIVRCASLRGRDYIIAGVDCGLCGRCYPDIGWAKLHSLFDGGEIATQQLWGP
jgi:hypothetical protein